MSGQLGLTIKLTPKPTTEENKNERNIFEKGLFGINRIDNGIFYLHLCCG